MSEKRVDTEVVVYGAAFQREDMLYDVYISTTNMFGRGMARDDIARPSFPPIAEGLRMCEAKREMKNRGCKLKHIAFRFFPKKILADKRNREFESEFGISRETIDKLICLKSKYDKIISLIDSLPSEKEFNELTKTGNVSVGNEYIDENKLHFRAMCKAASVLIKIRLEENAEAVRSMGVDKSILDRLFV